MYPLFKLSRIKLEFVIWVSHFILTKIEKFVEFFVRCRHEHQVWLQPKHIRHHLCVTLLGDVLYKLKHRYDYSLSLFERSYVKLAKVYDLQWLGEITFEQLGYGPF